MEQDGEDFYIVGADSVRKKLGNGSDDVFIGAISKNTENSVTFNCTAIPNYSTLKSEDFYMTDIEVLIHLYGGSGSATNVTLKPVFSYKNTTGILTVNDLFAGNKSYNYYAINNAKVWAKM